MSPDLKRLLASWQEIADRDLQQINRPPALEMISRTVQVERAALRLLLASIRRELPE